MNYERLAWSIRVAVMRVGPARPPDMSVRVHLPVTKLVEGPAWDAVWRVVGLHLNRAVQEAASCPPTP